MKNSIEEQMFSIEQSYSVESIEYKGVKLWPFLRTMIHYSKLKTQYVQSSQVFCDKFFRALKIMNEHLSGVLLTNFSLFKKINQVFSLRQIIRCTRRMVKFLID